MNKVGLGILLVYLLLGCSNDQVKLQNKKKIDSKSVAKQIASVSEKNKINPVDAYYLIMLESDFKPYTLTMYTKESVQALKRRFSKKKMPRIKNSRIHKNLRVFHFSSAEDSYNFIDTLASTTPYAVGLAGVPSNEYAFWDKDMYFDVEDNIKRGIERMKGCAKSFKKTKEQIECLNKLSNKDYREFTYWKEYQRLKR